MKIMRSKMLLGLGAVTVFLLGLPVTVAADCAPMPSDKGQLTQTVSIEASGTYALWIHQVSTPAESDSAFVQIDDRCPVVAGDNIAQNGFVWTNREDGNPEEQLLFNLTAGEHTVTVAGREAGNGIDRVMLTSNVTCQPTASNDTCSGESGNDSGAKDQARTVAATSERANWPVIIPCILVGLSAVSILIWKYVAFIRIYGHQGPAFVGGMPADLPTAQSKLLRFLSQQKRLVFICGWMAVAAIVIGFVAASSMGSSFEAESAALAGGATVVANDQASGGKYVLFQDNATAASSVAPGNSSQSGSSKKSSGSSPSGGQSSGSSSGSGSTAAPSCTLPKYPTPSCTGVPSGWTPSTTINGDLVVTEAFISGKPNRTIENYLVTGVLDVRANNVTIKKTRVYGKIDNFMTNTIYGPLLIEDSEVVLPPGQTVSGDYESSIGVSNYTCRRCKITGRAEGWRVGANSYPGAGNVTIEHSYAKLQVTQAQCDADDPHGDGIQGYGGNFATITHNTIDQRDDQCPTSPIFIPDQDNDGGNVTDNLLAGGGYSLRLLGGNFPTVTGNKIVNNSWAYGPVDLDCSKIGTWSNNSKVTFDWATGAILSTVGALNDC